MTCMMTFFAQAKLAFLSQNRGLKLSKFEKIWSNFYLDKKHQNSKFFAPRFARGEFLMSENFLKLKESPFPLYLPPRSSLTARSRPESYASAAAQIGQNPNFSTSKIFSKFFPMTCMMTFFAKANLAFLSQNRGRKLPKFGKIQSNFY